MNNPQPPRILCISAHPDDEVGGAGGTLLKFRNMGSPITLVLLGLGEQPDTPEEQAQADMRLAEFRRVGERLGGKTEFLNFPRYFQFSLENILAIARIIRLSGADIVFAPSTLEEHPEHVMAGRLAKEACRVARKKKYFTLGEPKRVTELRLYELDNAFTTFDMLEDITDVMEDKKRLFQTYESQKQNKDYVSAFVGLNQYRGITKRTGRFAEAFRIIRIL